VKNKKKQKLDLTLPLNPSSVITNDGYIDNSSLSTRKRRENLMTDISIQRIDPMSLEG
jgi:hypothetical protein